MEKMSEDSSQFVVHRRFAQAISAGNIEHTTEMGGSINKNRGISPYFIRAIKNTRRKYKNLSC